MNASHTITRAVRNGMKTVTAILLAAAVGLVHADMLAAQGIDYIKAHYTKYEYRIPMRDGKRLFTAVFVPKDTSTRYPILMWRTPYGIRPYGADQYRGKLGPSALFGKEGYIFVYQDVRGRWMSEGKFVDVRPQRSRHDHPGEIDESTDTWDTVDWLVKHIPNNSGKVGIWGISYPGFYAAAGIIGAHPAILAASPQAPISDWFIGDDWHRNGAFLLGPTFRFMGLHGQSWSEPAKKRAARLDPETPDSYRFLLRMGPLSEVNKRYFKDKVPFWNEMMRHGTYDAFWQARNLRPHLRNVGPAVMTVGGWFDAEDLFGPLAIYRRIESTSPKTANMLVMGPWRHSGWAEDSGSSFGDIPFNSKTAEFFRAHIEFPFFQFHLKGKGPWNPPEAWVFETGTNQWRQYQHWPPKHGRTKSLYLRADGGLAFDPPAEAAPQHAYDEYVSDPAKPVPFLGQITGKTKPEYMVADQRFASRRPDVAVYETSALTHDVRLAGPVDVELFVSTSGTDSDWIVKLIDVYPDDYPDPKNNPRDVRMGGYQQLVRGDVMRGKFRNSFERPEPFMPNRPTRVKFTLADVCHCFRSGHRIMVQVQCSWFPLVDRNPQKFVDIYHAHAADFQKATQRVYRTSRWPSRLQVRELP